MFGNCIPLFHIFVVTNSAHLAGYPGVLQIDTSIEYFRKQLNINVMEAVKFQTFLLRYSCLCLGCKEILDKTSWFIKKKEHSFNRNTPVYIEK